MEPYLYIMKTRMMKALAYRFDVLTAVLVQCFLVVVTAFFWIAVYGGRDSAAGVTEKQMLTYTIMSGVLSCLFTINVESRISQSIQKGDIALDILKPVNLFGIYLAEDTGNLLILLFQNVLPLLLVSALFIQVPVPASALLLLLFIVTTAISYLINWLLSVTFGMLSFWLISMGPLSSLKICVIRMLSGSIIPLWFFPEWLRNILAFLPFQYIYQLPLSIYIGKLTEQETIFQVGVQLVWLLILYGLYRLMQRKVLKNVMVQGG